jgi:hypothetical protein
MSTAAKTATATASPMPIHGVSPAFTTSSTVTYAPMPKNTWCPNEIWPA